MKDAGSFDDLLARWRSLAELENKRARKTWGVSGKPGWPDDSNSGSTQSPEMRAARDAEVMTLAAAGLSKADISRGMGIPLTTVWRIMRRCAVGQKKSGE